MVMRKKTLDQKIDAAVYKLGMQENRLDHIGQNTDDFAKNLFDKCVEAQLEKDGARAALYATEYTQAKKVGQTIASSKMAVEQIGIRLKTTKELYGVAEQIKPVAKIARSVGGDLSRVTPNVADQMREMNAALDVTLVAAGDIVSDSSGPISTHESEDILQQASLVADQRLKERFPTTPGSATAEREAAKGQ